MRMTLVLAACLLAPCTGFQVTGSLARQRGGPPLGAASAASLRVGKESAAYATALGYLLDMAGVPMALRVPAARAVIDREADLLERLHGYTSGAEAFRSHMPRLVPDAMMYYCKDPVAEEEGEGEDEEGANASEHGGGRGATLSRVRTQGTEITRDGEGGFTVRTTTCVDGECTRSSKTVDRTGAGHITPRVPLSTIARMMAGMSNIARQLEEELEELPEVEEAGSVFPGTIGGAPGSAPSAGDEAAPSGEEATATGLDTVRAAMEKIMEHGPLVPVVQSLDPLREMMDRSIAARMPPTPRPDTLDPFEDLRGILKGLMPGFGEGFPFGPEPPEGPSPEPSEGPSDEGPAEKPSEPVTLGDVIHRIFKKEPAGDGEPPEGEERSGDDERSEDEGPSEDEERPSEANPLAGLGDLIHRILEDMSGDAPGGPGGGGSEHPRRSFTVTRISGGHAVQEVTTCGEGPRCTTETHEYDLPADGARGGRGDDGSAE